MSRIYLVIAFFGLDISAEYGGWSLDWGLELWRRELWEVEGGALGQQPLPDEPALENPSKSPTPTLQLGQISSTKKISCKKVRNTHPPQVCSLVHALTLLKYCAISFLAGHMVRRRFVTCKIGAIKSWVFPFFDLRKKNIVLHCTMWYCVLCIVYCTMWCCMKLPGIAWNWTLLHCPELWSCVDTTEVIVSDWCEAGARPNENLSASFPCDKGLVTINRHFILNLWLKPCP